MDFDFLPEINTLLGWRVLRYGISFLIVLKLVVFFHELGHFLVARWFGVRVLVFSIGFGPELWGFNDRHGTRWKISAIPLGGYVKFFGDENAASVPDQEALAAMTEAERQQSFVHQKLAPRAAIVVAGPLANFLLAIVVFAGLFMIYGKPNASQPRVDVIQQGSAAAVAGFQPGDLVLTIDGRKIESFAEMQRIVRTSAAQTLSITVERGGKQVTLAAVPVLKEEKDTFGNIHRIGVLGISRSVAQEEQRAEPVGPMAAIWLGVEQCWMIVETTLSVIGRIVVQRESADQLGGPIMIVQVSGQVATLGIAAFLHFVAVLSVSIGLLNLFPVPLLDGGHLLFYAVEAVLGRPLSERAQEIGFRIGFVLVAALMIFATKNDIYRLWNLAAS
jgi:regulator of sigma E protease